jgi:hypothetical protein
VYIYAFVCVLVWPGNLDYYTQEALLAREKLKHHPAMTAHLDLWWADCIEHYSGGDGILQKIEYRGWYYSLLEVIMSSGEAELKAEGATEDLTNEQISSLFEEDWERDAGGREHLEREGFHTAVVVLADAWCDSLNLQVLR